MQNESKPTLDLLSDRWSNLWRARSYDVLPALRVRGPELRNSLRTVTMAWMFGSIWWVAIGPATMVALGNLAGFNDFHWGLLAALTYAATPAQIPSSYLIERTGLRKQPFLYISGIQRLLWVFVGLMPLALFAFSSTTVIWMTMAIIFASWVFAHGAWPVWATWMSDLIPPRIRGRYFARRNAYCILVQIAAAIAFGAILDAATNSRAPNTVANQPVLVWALLGIFIVAGAFGLVDPLLFRRIRELARPASRERLSLRQIFSEPLSNPQFVHYVASTATLTFSIALVAGFFAVTCRNFLNLDNVTTNFLLLACGPIGAVVSSRLWGHIIDHYGLRAVLLLATGASALTVWAWLLVPFNRPSAADPAFWDFLRHWAPLLVPHNPPGVLTVAVLATVLFLDGMVTLSGIPLAQFNMLLSFSDKGGRSTYVAASGVLVAIAGLLGGLTGGQVAQWIRHFRWEIGPFVLVNYHLMFLASGVIRLGSLGWLAGMADPGGKPLRKLFRDLPALVARGMAGMAFLPAELIAALVRRIVRRF